MSELALPESKAHDLFYIPELLEAILLNLDMHTLLISARVCYMWNDLIKTSRKIQQTLFYIPCDTVGRHKPRVKNPLVVDRIWPDFICTRLYSRVITEYSPFEHVTQISSREREQAYLRPEASWRRMLLQQPPNSSVYFWCSNTPKMPYICLPDCPSHTSWTPRGEYIRMEHMAHWADVGVFLPKSLFSNEFNVALWAFNGSPLVSAREGKKLTREPRLTQSLARFDLTVNSEIPCHFLSPDSDARETPWLVEWCIERGVVALYEKF